MAKSFILYNYYQKRDFIYKCSLNNAYDIPNISKIVVSQTLDKKDELFANISSFILLFDRLPFISHIMKTGDKKLKKTPVEVIQTFSLLAFSPFFYRIKMEDNYLSLAKKLLTNKSLGYLNVRFNIFEEFLNLYDKYSNLSSLSINFIFKHCNSSLDKKLLLSNLLTS
jgi:hypothetical protein